ncbi:MAG TPA: hypothetical protein VF103_08035 [Polyangiaceae bacterium]
MVPPSEELRNLGTRSVPPEVSGAMLRPSSRPSSRPTASFGPPPKFEQAFYDAPPQAPLTSFPPLEKRRRPRSRARSIVAKVLFAILFAGVATLLGLALAKKFAARSQIPGTYFSSIAR